VQIELCLENHTPQSSPASEVKPEVPPAPPPPVETEDLVEGQRKKRAKETRPRLKREGWTGHELYQMWQGIKSRCRNPRCPGWENYGGRGIRLSERWMDFSLFEKDMGTRPSKAHQIDRIDNGGNYEPGNCRWATKLEQMANTRHNHYLEFNGDVLHISAWARRLGIPISLIKRRLDRGWSAKDTLSKPAKTKRFTSEEIDFIRKSVMGCTKLAMVFDVSKTTISKIKLGRTYRCFPT
jgi:hypothetical protein